MHSKLALYGMVPVMFLGVLFGGVLKEAGVSIDHALQSVVISAAAAFALLLAIDHQLDTLRAGLSKD